MSGLLLSGGLEGNKKQPWEAVLFELEGLRTKGLYVSFLET